jgi:hypothetical protein
MSSIRIAAAGAALLLLSGLSAGGAAAQTATDQATGQPLQLLRWLHLTSQANKPTTRPRAKLAERKTLRTASAFTKHRRLPVETAEATPPATKRPAVNPIAPMETTITTAALVPAPQPALMPSVPVPNELVVAGQTVQVAPPDEVNELDIAANDTQPSASDVSPADTLSRPRTQYEIAEATSKSDSLLAAPQQSSASQANNQVNNQVSSQVSSQASNHSGSQVGTASWIAQVLAALGGAVAAGSAAWFLIGVTPQRTYG